MLVATLLFSAVASAGITDWFDTITGMNVAEGGDNSEAVAEEPAEPVAEDPVEEAVEEETITEEQPSTEEPTEEVTNEVEEETEVIEETQEEYVEEGDEYVEEETDTYVDEDPTYVEESTEETSEDHEQECWACGEKVDCDEVEEKNKECKPEFNKKPEDFKEKPKHPKGHFDQKEKYGDAWCANGQCCPDTICDDYEQKTNGCPEDCGYGEGEEQQRQGPMCVTDEQSAEMESKCQAEGGNPIINDNENCRTIHCEFQSQGYFIGEHENNLEEQKRKCKQMGLFPDVHPGMNGLEVHCVEEGQEKHGAPDKELSATEALEVALKVDGAIRKLEELGTKLGKLQDHYNSNGDDESAENYGKAKDAVNNGIEGLKAAKENMVSIIEENNGIGVEHIIMLKDMVKTIVDESLTQAAYAILGADISAEEIESTACGDDAECFAKMFHNCPNAVGSTYSPESDVQMEISGFDNNICLVSITVENNGVDCKFTNGQYKYMPLSKETFGAVCPEIRMLLKGEKSQETDVANSGYVCCQPESAEGKACMVKTGSLCQSGYKTLEGEYIDPENEYNCVGHKTGNTAPFCEGNEVTEQPVEDETVTEEEPSEETTEQPVETEVEEETETLEETQEEVEEAVEAFDLEVEVEVI